MSDIGSQDRPLRVAVIGSGPAGFYTIQHLLAAPGLEVRVDLFERLPAPFGLVRHGVAPDHPKIKSVTAVYDRLARNPRVRFYGGVEYGSDLSLADLHRHYDQVVFCTGAQTDRRLGIAGEDLERSHAATEFVAWYNGHPDYADRVFDLSHERVLVVGVGNVAIDVARILCRTPDELARTDIAEHALEALRRSRVREVILAGRRGPAQAAFTNPEIKELGELQDAVATALPGELELDALSRAAVAQAGDKALARKLELLSAYAGRSEPHKSKRLVLRFLVSPLELLDDGAGGVGGVRLVRNELVAGADGGLRARATVEEERHEIGLVFRSVGYRGVPLPELPFDDARGVIPNDAGRVLEAPGGAPRPGLYVSGWIKRGPSGVIGTNKPDAAETVASMLADLRGATRPAAEPDVAAVEQGLRRRGVPFLRYDDWLRLDAVELERGRRLGRPRLKLVRREEFARALIE